MTDREEQGLDVRHAQLTTTYRLSPPPRALRARVLRTLAAAYRLR
ncbi:MAG TPA: hypothetical protein VJY65_13515 [Chloroflexota bacterium]|nr:hypothetical protein [Chloroflexota bacterium]